MKRSASDVNQESIDKENGEFLRIKRKKLSVSKARIRSAIIKGIIPLPSEQDLFDFFRNIRFYDIICEVVPKISIQQTNEVNKTASNYYIICFAAADDEKRKALLATLDIDQLQLIMFQVEYLESVKLQMLNVIENKKVHIHQDLQRMEILSKRVKILKDIKYIIDKEITSCLINNAQQQHLRNSNGQEIYNIEQHVAPIFTNMVEEGRNHRSQDMEIIT